MDISVYKSIKSGLKAHFESLKLSKSYNPNVVGFEPSNPTYPMVKIVEVRNSPFEQYNRKLERVSSLGYRIDIYAKTSGSIAKDDIARNIAKHCDDYLTCIGLKQVSWNVVENDGLDGQLYHIITMYSATYYENRETILIK